MKSLFFLITSCCILMSFEIFSEEVENLQNECIEEDTEEVPCIRRFKRIDNYENSVIVDPIEREPQLNYPGAHESSFYEQMTR